MDVEYTGRRASVTKKLKQQAEAGLARVEKIVGHAGRAQVTLFADKHRQMAEIRIQTRTQKLVAVCEAADMEGALRDALDKVERQAVRQKKRTVTIKRHPKGEVKLGQGKAVVETVAPALTKNVTARVSAKSSAGSRAVPMLVHSFPSRSPLAEPHIARSTEAVALRPMSLEEAVKEAAFRDRDIFVFRDYSGQAMVLHRRRDGKMELIEVP
jgi:putative sigma-54 modulation protein